MCTDKIDMIFTLYFFHTYDGLSYLKWHYEHNVHVWDTFHIAQVVCKYDVATTKGTFPQVVLNVLIVIVLWCMQTRSYWSISNEKERTQVTFNDTVTMLFKVLYWDNVNQGQIVGVSEELHELLWSDVSS